MKPDQLEPNKKSLDAKRAELLGIASAAVAERMETEQARKLADIALNAFVQITAPMSSGASGERIDMVVVNAPPSGGATARSHKPGNIWLNWRKLIDLVPDVVTSGYTAIGAPQWILPLIGLQIWSKVRQASDVPLQMCRPQ